MQEHASQLMQWNAEKSSLQAIVHAGQTVMRGI